MSNGDDGGYGNLLGDGGERDRDPELERVMRRREIELDAKRRAQALRRQEVADLAWLAVLWTGANVLIYMVTGFLFFSANPNIAMPKNAAILIRPMWLLFQLVINVVIIAGIRLSK